MGEEHRRIEPRAVITGTGTPSDPEEIRTLHERNDRRGRSWRGPPKRSFGNVLRETPTDDTLEAPTEDPLSDESDRRETPKDPKKDARNASGENDAEAQKRGGLGDSDRTPTSRLPPDPRQMALHNKFPVTPTTPRETRTPSKTREPRRQPERKTEPRNPSAVSDEIYAGLARPPPKKKKRVRRDAVQEMPPEEDRARTKAKARDNAKAKSRPITKAGPPKSQSATKRPKRPSAPKAPRAQDSPDALDALESRSARRSRSRPEPDSS